MNSVFIRATRFVPSEVARTSPASVKSAASTRQLSRGTSLCLRCQLRALSQQQERQSRHSLGAKTEHPDRHVKRYFSSSKTALTERDGPQETSPAPRHKKDQSTTPGGTNAVRIAPDEDLPSHKEGLKWALTKRLNTFMDSLLARLAIAGHEINKYTGTDYSGIEALRVEIKEQEELVKARHDAVRLAKAAFDEAQTLQMASQKEVVSLLERKNSWSSTDLERYMSLIRSEHVNEQDVTVARESLLASERRLEEARTRLERRERAQYHEEQIWSDSIRRNSTWVTFGLMGFNVVLLLANIGIVEPWRRSRMVREIKSAMDEKGQANMGHTLEADTSEAERAIDSAIGLPVPLEEDPTQNKEPFAGASTNNGSVGGTVGSESLQVNVAEHAASLSGNSNQDMLHAGSTADHAPQPGSAPFQTQHASLLGWVKFHWDDLRSLRAITLRKIDLTTIVLESITAGATASALLIFLLRVIILPARVEP